MASIVQAPSDGHTATPLLYISVLRRPRPAPPLSHGAREAEFARAALLATAT